jgi:hypothetical protein
MRNWLPSAQNNDAIQLEKRRLRWARLAESRKLCMGERVEHCNWTPISYVVEIWKKPEGKAAYFKAVATCGSVWMCPVCAEKITTERQKDLLLAITAAKLLGLTVYMITYTVGHKQKDSAENVLRLMMDATGKLKGRKFWTRIRSRLDIVGSVTSLESTFNPENGTHAHKHVLEFARNEITAGQINDLRNEISAEYEKIVDGLGGYVDGVHDVDIKLGSDYVAEYIAKIGHDPAVKNFGGVSYEITKGATKKISFRDGHYTAFQLLDLSAEGDSWARKMFIEYRKAFKGKYQIKWSKGLHELLGMDKEKTDQELAESTALEDYNFANMTKEDWKLARVVPHEILEAARTMGYRKFCRWVLRKYKITIESPVLTLVSEWNGESITFG